MKHLAAILSVWLLKLLPARFARSWAAAYSSVANNSATGRNGIRQQLLVDISVIHQSDARTGIQRVVRALFLQLLESPPIGYSVRPIFATAQHGYRYASVDFLNNVTPCIDTVIQPVGGQLGDIFLGLDLAAHLIHRHQTQIFQLKRTGVKVHVMVYDLLPLQHPEWFNKKTTRNFKRWIKWLAVYADSAICISETVKIELATWLQIKFGMVSGSLSASTIVLGANIEASAPSKGMPHEAQFFLARMRDVPSILMVGTIEPRKGHDQVLAAFELLWKHSSNAPLLVLVGRPGWKTEALQKTLRTHQQIGKKLFWFEDASDELLSHLYVASSGVLVASRAEGFGLPLIEAALHAKPVLAREIPVFREMKLGNVNYFNGNTHNELAAAILNWDTDTAISYPQQSLAHLPTWQLSAKQLINALGLSHSYPDIAVSASTMHKHSGGMVV